MIEKLKSAISHKNEAEIGKPIQANQDIRQLYPRENRNLVSPPPPYGKELNFDAL